jgi:hypothetical protein
MWQVHQLCPGRLAENLPPLTYLFCWLMSAACGAAVAEAGRPVAEPGQEQLSAGRALGSAETLASLQSQNGHLLHMPSHIFVRVGQYKRAVTTNKAAYDHDLARGSQCIVPYLPEHNVNLLVYAARCAGGCCMT